MAVKTKTNSKTKTKAKQAKKVVARKKAPSKKTTAVTIVKATPSRSGAEWMLTLSDGGKAKVDSAAAQSIGVRVGGKWSDAVAARIAGASKDQALFTRAMHAISRKPATGRAALAKLLGGDDRAKATVAVLAKHGWIA
jgi:hypothetical protein